MGKPTKPPPVVRVTIEMYPKRYDEGDEHATMQAAEEAAGYLYGQNDVDYRRPRVVSVKRVRGGSK